MPPKLLRIIITIAALACIAGIGYNLWKYYTILLPTKPYSTLRIIGHHVQFLTDLSLPFVAMLIALKSKADNALWLALALVAYTLLGQIILIGGPLYYLVSIGGTIIVGQLFIFATQQFPVQIQRQQVAETIKTRWLRNYLGFFLKPRNLWIGMTLILLAISIAEVYLPFLLGVPTSLLILLTGLGYFYISFKVTTGVDHARTLWLFWGLAMYTITMVLYLVLNIYSTGPDDVVQLLIAILSLLILFFSFMMSLFWADTFNTGRFVRRSTVNAILFLLVVFIYNTLEHYVLHWVSHKLHISDAMVSSLLSGVLVLCINPLHHRLTAFLNRRLTKGKVESHH